MVDIYYICVMDVNQSKINSIFGERLKTARKMAGFSLQVLSDNLGNLVTKQALSKYEQGHMLPDGHVLIALARALHVTIDYFYNSPEVLVELRNIEYRKRARFTKTEQKGIETKAIDFLERYFELENLLQNKSKFSLKLVNKRISNSEEVEVAAREFRKQLNLGDAPIFSVFELLEDNGCKVFEVSASMDFDGMNADANGEPIVIINEHFSVERKRFSALHEIAHYLLEFEENLEHKTMENLCHQFAGAVLFPKERFIQEVAAHRLKFSLNELVLLKEYWGVSIKAIIVRARTLGVISQNVYVDLLKAYNRRSYNQNEPGVYPVPERAIRFKQLLLRAVAENVVSLNYAASLANMKVSELRDEFDLMK